MAADEGGYFSELVCGRFGGRIDVSERFLYMINNGKTRARDSQNLIDKPGPIMSRESKLTYKDKTQRSRVAASHVPPSHGILEYGVGAVSNLIL